MIKAIINNHFISFLNKIKLCLSCFRHRERV